MSVQKKIEDGREYRNIALEVRENGQEFVVEGYASTFNQPYVLYHIENDKVVEEQVDARAFDNADMSDVIFQYDHEGRVFARLSNDTLKLSTDEHGLFVSAYLGGTQEGRNLYEEIKGGYTNKMSFGFTVKDDEITETKKGYLRTLRSISKVYDVSAVSLPANDYTEISARSHCDGAIAEIEAERLQAEEEARKLAEQKEILVARLKGLRKE